jgi:hypothetical protein
LGWEDFLPGGDKGLQYGQPANLSYAAFFDLTAEEFQEVNLIRITVTDYLDYQYRQTVTVPPMMKGMALAYSLFHDPP